MGRIVVLGGAGAVGRVAVKTLLPLSDFSEVVIADMDRRKAEKVREELGSAKAVVREVDILNPQSLRSALAGCELVLNCSGPFYKLVRPVLAAVLELKLNYVDICDDVDVTLDLLELDAAAKKAGVTALIGMGSSPGATNLLAKFAADQLLEQTDSIDIFHTHGGEPFEGEGVIAHRFHCMSIEIPMFLEGELKFVKFFEPEGVALREEFEFPVLGRTLLYPYPHPEQVTLPRYIKCQRVTNKGSVLPAEYYNLIRDLCALGLSDKEPVSVQGQLVSPHDFAIAFIIREREKILQRLNFGSQRGCVSVIVKGKKEGKTREFRFHLVSKSQALGEGTGIPAAAGAILMKRGKVKGPGVLPPEAGVNPLHFLELIPQIMKLEKKEGAESFSGVLVEEVDEEGRRKRIEL